MSAIEQYDNSLLKAIKVTLINYFNTQTGIKWDQPEKLEFVPNGWINIYNYEKFADSGNTTKIRKPFDKGHYNKYKIQFQLTLLNNSVNSLDNKLLNMSEFIVDVFSKLQLTGCVIDPVTHPLFKSATMLKSIKLINVEKTIKQLSDGNQDDQTDSLYQGTLNFYTELIE